MIYISEFLPNPAGKDTEGEWIEICSAGDENESLHRWKIQNTKGKTFTLPDRTLEPYACVAFDYADTKLTLTNTGGAFYLVNQTGDIADRAVYEGTYKDNVSSIRTHPTSVFVMTTTPTKGYANILTKPETRSEKNPQATYETTVVKTTEQQARVIHGERAFGEIVLTGVLVAGILTALFWYALRKVVQYT